MRTSVKRSLSDLLGQAYTTAAARAAAALGGAAPQGVGEETVDFFPQAFADRLDALLPQVGQALIASPPALPAGAPTAAYGRAFDAAAAPLGGLGYYRLGEDGRLYMAAKSEHYQVPLGHRFPGFALLEKARSLGVCNPCHNNTRGYITRLLERRLVMAANGLEDEAALEPVLQSTAPRVLNRVINLQTGSVAVEAAAKMMLARFYRLEAALPPPVHEGKTPVFLVMADAGGGPEGNYHGTCLMTQTLRGLWPELTAKAAQANLYRVVPVTPNSIADFREKIALYNTGPWRTAGFLHEIVLMNYGATLLTKDYLQAAYALCERYETPVLADEIQSGAWVKGLFLSRLWGLRPDFIAIGKGFPGGEYAASKLLTTYEMDTLSQFGALVTNGQEELASLANLIVMEYVLANGDEVARMGALLDAQRAAVAADFPALVSAAQGFGHCFALHFDSVDTAVRFTKTMNARGVDVSAQTYKVHCPPAALFKPPVILGDAGVNCLYGHIRAVLQQLREGNI